MGGLSKRSRIARAFIRARLRPAFARWDDIGRVRRVLGSRVQPAPAGVSVTPGELGGVPGEWLTSAASAAADGASPARMLLYVHGGGFAACSPGTHRALTGALAAAGWTVFAVDYRLAPEHPFPAAVEDVAAAWAALTHAAPAGARLALAGDSAGGNLATVTAAAAAVKPHALALLSPVLDLTGGSASLASNAGTDAMLHPDSMPCVAQTYLQGADPADPRASPLLDAASVAALPPVLALVAADEMLRDDGVRLARRVRAAGGRAEAHAWPGVPHAWPVLPPAALPEAAAAVATLAHFLATADAAAPEAIDVAIVGGGLSAIAAAVRLREQMPGAKTVLFEARSETGGTWSLFRYPNARSDSDMHTLGFKFAPWRGPTSIAAAGDILAYLRDVAARSGVDALVRTGHRVVAADWVSAERVWSLTVDACPAVAAAEGAAAAVPGPGPDAWAGAAAAAAAAGGGRRPAPPPPAARAPAPARPPPPATRPVRAKFVNFCAGYYDYAGGHAPKLPNQEAFAGRVIHPQAWPDGETLAGRRVVVLGSGATAVTLAPALAAAGASVVLLQRSPSHVVAVPRRDSVALSCVRCGLPSLARYWAYWRARALYSFARRFPDAAARGIQRAALKAVGPGVPAEAFTPSYPPWDQRLCIAADGDLFKAIKDGQVEIVTGEVESCVQGGLVLRSGRTLECDTIVTATGLRLLPLGGATISVDGCPIDLAARSSIVWRGAMLASIPNLFATMGYSNASWTLRADLTARWVARTVAWMARRGYETVAPRAPAPDVRPVPIVSLRSGYIERATGMPSAGHRGPWRPPASWPADEAALGCCGGWRARRDGVLQFA